MNWQAIETAPKDGRLIRVAWIVNWPTVEETVVTSWDNGEWKGHYTPTHWAPLDPPEE